MNEFNQKEYKNTWRKNNIKQFNVDLNIEEYENLTKMLNYYNLRKIDFIRQAINHFKEEKKMKKYCVRCDTSHFVKDSKGWRFDNNVIYGNNDCEKVFNTIEEATEFYNSIELTDDIQNNSRYANYKALYEIDETDYEKDENEVDLNDAKIIRDDTLFTNYH